MFEASHIQAHEHAVEIARHEVSDDGVTWRPYDPKRDNARPILHQRIEFAPPAND